MQNRGAEPIHEIDFDHTNYYIQQAEKPGTTWDEVPEYINDT